MRKRYFLFGSYILLNLNSNETTSSDLNQVLDFCLTSNDSHPVIVERITYTFLYLRKLKLSKDMGGYKYIGVELLTAANALLRIGSFDRAYMFAEMYWSSYKFQYEATPLPSQIADRVFKGTKVEDMYYATPISASTSTIFEMAAHENDYHQMLQFQLAMFRGDLQSSITNMSGQIDSAKSLANNLERCGFNSISSLVTENMPTNDNLDLYSCAWKLQNGTFPLYVTQKQRRNCVQLAEKSP